MPNITVPANAISLSAIFREAHAAARRRMAPQSYPGAGREWDAGQRAFVVIDRTYRQALARALRAAWADAKADFARAALEARRPKLTDAERARLADLDAMAWAQDFTTGGVRNARLLRDEMSAIRAAAATRQRGAPMAP